MAESCVVAVYPSLQQARAAAHILERADFPGEQMMVLGSQADETPRMIDDLSMGDDSLRDAAYGAGIGGALGVLTGASASFVTGVAVVAFAAPLAGGLVGVMVGALVGGLAGWGVHTSQIAHYHKRLKAGNAMLIAEGDPLEVAHADRVLQETGATELHVHSRDGSESAEITQPLLSTVDESESDPMCRFCG